LIFRDAGHGFACRDRVGAITRLEDDQPRRPLR
jgi:hypothetical protein